MTEATEQACTFSNKLTVLFWSQSVQSLSCVRRFEVGVINKMPQV